MHGSRRLVVGILVLTGGAMIGAATWAVSNPNANFNPEEPGPQVVSGVESYGDELGTVRFPTSCNEAASHLLERGLALLHHMTYEGARATFATVAEADPACAMGAWGEAMTFIHPLWSDPPTVEDFQHGVRLVEEARQRGEKSERERAYIEAVAGYYDAGKQQIETANLAAFETGWQKVHEQFPDDPEAALFYALAHLGTADPADKSYAHQKRSGAIAESVLARIPDHPGGHHYAIHAYDYPPLASKALEIARNYGEIAPAVPHALHMPTHIFTRLGLWEDSIRLNRRSAAAALRHPAGEKISLHYPHALDYLAYAYLQRGQDDKAEQIQARLESLEGPFQIEIATPYTLAAVPARLVLERQRWAEAARLEPRQPTEYPWERFPAMEAITHFARGLGAARSGDAATARQALTKLQTLRDQAAETSGYWAQQVEIQRLSVLAWQAFAEGDHETALATMRRAAELEASTEKHPVTPGEVLPARELLADMLLELDRVAEARDAYAVSLQRSPRRFNGVYGAARAAELAGNLEAAAERYDELLELASDAASDRTRLTAAQEFLENQRTQNR